MTRPRRSEAERFRLLDQIVERLSQEPAVGGHYSLELKFDHKTGVTFSETTPPRSELRSLLMEVRKLDSPGEDAYLPDLLELAIAKATDPEWRQGLEDARKHHTELQTHGNLRVDDGRGEVSPRLALELWAYGEHLHDDPDKAARMAAMPPDVAVLVRHNAAGYMDDLVRIAIYVRSAKRHDPGLN